jgi:hypothetical protein
VVANDKSIGKFFSNMSFLVSSRFVDGSKCLGYGRSRTNHSVVLRIALDLQTKEKFSVIPIIDNGTTIIHTFM